MPKTSKVDRKRARMKYDIDLEYMVKSILQRARLYAEDTMAKGYVFDLKGPDKDQCLEMVAEVLEDFDAQVDDEIRRQAELEPKTKKGFRYPTTPKE